MEANELYNDACIKVALLNYRKITMIEDLTLIELVRQNGVLYNRAYGGHRNPAVKKQTWIKIAAELGSSDEICMKRWTSLRERYSREKKRIIEQANDNSIQPFAEQWPLYDAMSFLNHHVKPRVKRDTFDGFHDSPLSLHEASLPASSPHLEYLENPPTPDGALTKLDVEFSAEKPKGDYSSSSEKFSDDPNPSISSHRVRKRKANSSFRLHEDYQEQEEEEEEDYRPYHVTGNHCQDVQSEKKNVAVHAFGQMIVATICELSRKKQAQAMKKITDIVMTLQMEEEDEKDNDTNELR